jgi:O-antigen/teichoic acid export membrane protein
MRRWIGDRGRSLLAAGSWSAVAKVSTAANLFLSIPFALAALDPAEFGVWVTLLSIVALSGFMDLGTGNGTMNLLADAYGRGQPALAHAIVRESRAVLSWIAVVFAIVGGAICFLLPWQAILGAPTIDTARLFIAVGMVLVATVLSTPLALGYRIHLALGNAQRAFQWQAAGQLGGLAALAITSASGGDLLALVAASITLPIVAAAASTVDAMRNPFLRSQRTTAEHAGLRGRILSEGSMFFVLQLCAVLAFSCDLLIISAQLGAEHSGGFAVAQRLFSIIPLSLGLLWGPLWPMYRRALAAGERQWIMRTFNLTLTIAIAYSISAASMLAWAAPFLLGSIGADVGALSAILIAGFAIWAILESIGTAVGTLLNGASQLRFQVATSIVFATLCITGKVLLVNDFGTAALPWVTVVSYAAAWLLPFILMRRSIMDRIGLTA